MAVEQRYIDAARRQQQELLARSPHAKFGPKSELEPIRLILAEYRYLGISVVEMHKYAAQLGFKTKYSNLLDWVNRHIGKESGPGSKSEQILRDAAARGHYTSPYLNPTPAGLPADSPAATVDTSEPDISRARDNEGLEAPAPATGPSAPRLADSGEASAIPQRFARRALDPEQQQRVDVLREGAAQFSTPFGRIHERSKK